MSERDDLGNTAVSAARTTALAAPVTDVLPSVGEDRYGTPEGDPELGRGGMGRVLRLNDPHLGREVAVKELLPAHRQDALMETLFVREARVLARLEHPGVVPVYEIGRRPDGAPYYAMRRIRGRSLKAVSASCASLSDRLALLGHFLTVVQTMGFAHSRGIVHRDLKPENVMVSGFGETLVIDWGLAIVDGVVAEAVTAGTPTHMAPEQCTGASVDAQSDVWSLGVMLFELLAGKLPFSGANSTEVLNRVQNAVIPKVLDYEPDAPRALVRVVERALQRNPAARFANAGGMADALEAAMREREPQQRGAVIAAAALGVAFVLALGWALTARSTAENAQRDARLKVGDAERKSGTAIGAAALAALRTHDGFAASRLAADAPENALATGVGLLAQEAGLPTREWSVATEAGCATLVIVDGLIACPTLNAVLLFDRKGTTAGTLSTGVRGWQHAAAVLPDHKLATGGDDRVLRTFNLATRQLDEVTPAFPSGITALAADGATVSIGLNNGDVVSREGVVLFHHQRAVLTMVAAPSLLASSAGESMHVVRQGSEASLDRRAGAMVFSNGSLVVGVERTVAELGPDGVGRSWGEHFDEVSALAVLGDGRVVSGGLDRTLRWWSPSGQAQGVASGLEAPVRALAAIDDLVVVAMGREIKAFKLPTARAAAWDERPSAIAVSATRKQVFAGFIDGRVRRFDLPNGPAETLEVRHTATVRTVVEVPGEDVPENVRVLTGGDDGQVRAQRWNGEVESLDSLPGVRVLAIAVSADGQRAAWSADDGSLVLYSLQFSKEISRTKQPVARALAFSTDGRTLALGRDDKRLALVNSETGALELEADPFDAAVTSLAWLSPNTVALGRADGTVSAYDRLIKNVTARWTGLPTVRVSALRVHQQTLLAGTEDGEVFVWTLEGGAPRLQFVSDSGNVGDVAVVDGSLIYSGTDRLVHAVPLTAQ